MLSTATTNLIQPFPHEVAGWATKGRGAATESPADSDRPGSPAEIFGGSSGHADKAKNILSLERKRRIAVSAHLWLQAISGGVIVCLTTI